MERTVLTELALAAREGDPEAFSALYGQCAQRVYYLALQMLKSREDAADCMQEVFLQAFRHIDRLEHPEGVLTWLYRITANRCKNRLRRRGELSWDGENMPEPVEACEEFLPQACLESAEKRRLLQEIVDALPADQRACVVLYYYSELPVPEIARLLECPEGTVKSRLNYARQKIRAGILAVEERDGIRLHVFVPAPLIFACLQQVPPELAPAAGVVEEGWQAVAAGLGLAVGGVGAAAGDATVKAAAGTTKRGFWTVAKVRVAAGATAAAVAVTGVSVALTGRSAALRFDDPVVEAQLRNYLGKPDGAVRVQDVAEIERICIADDHWFINGDMVSYYGSRQNNLYSVYPVEGAQAEPPSVASLEGLAPDFGTAASYDTLTQLPALRTLTIIQEPLEDLAFLGEMPALEALTLSFVPDQCLTTLPPCPTLKHLSLVGQSASTPISVQGCPLTSLHLFAFTDGSPMGWIDLAGQDQLKYYNYNLFPMDETGAVFPELVLGDLLEAPNLELFRAPVAENQRLPAETLIQLQGLRCLDLGYVSREDLTVLAGLPRLEAVSATLLDGTLDDIMVLDGLPSMRVLIINTGTGGYLNPLRCDNTWETFQKVRMEIEATAGMI